MRPPSQAWTLQELAAMSTDCSFTAALYIARAPGRDNFQPQTPYDKPGQVQVALVAPRAPRKISSWVMCSFTYSMMFPPLSSRLPFLGEVLHLAPDLRALLLHARGVPSQAVVLCLQGLSHLP